MVYKPISSGTLYAGWGTSFNPSSESVSFISSGRNLTTSNAFLDPEENESFELGLKWELVADRLDMEAAVFRITKDNARVPDPLNPGFNALAGKQIVEGFSLNVSGYLTDTFHLIAGYTLLDGEQNNSLNGAVNPMQNLAENAFNLWGSLDLSSSFTLAAGVNYQSDRHATATKSVNGYTALDAMASWQVNEKISLKFNVTNLTDKYYIDQIHPWHVIPGPGRNVTLALNLDY